MKPKFDECFVSSQRHDMLRNHLAFVLSIYSGLRVGEIAALTVANGPAPVPRELSRAGAPACITTTRSVLTSS